MKLTTKKIIAREFLTLTIILALGLISYLSTYPYNAYKWNQVKSQKNEILEKIKMADSLSLSFKYKLNKQNWFFEKFSNHYDLSGDTTFDSRDEIWKVFDKNALNDSIKYKWEKKWAKEDISNFRKIGFPNPKAFQTFIEKNRIIKVDSSNYKSSIAINSEVVLLSNNIKENEIKVLSYKEQTEFGLKSLIICFIILFGFRYLFYSIKWSIKTLKQKTE